jgi:MerR family transcriptional regulator, repressor of the yfmOP operon
MSTTQPKALRIGEVAELTGTTPRTIRYYEEIGLLGAGVERELGRHRTYTEADVERLTEIVRLRDLLGLSLEQLAQLVEAETGRAGIRRELQETEDPDRRAALLTQSKGFIETQLALVRGRLGELQALETELAEKLQLVHEKLAALQQPPAPSRPRHN